MYNQLWQRPEGGYARKLMLEVWQQIGSGEDKLV